MGRLWEELIIFCGSTVAMIYLILWTRLESGTMKWWKQRGVVRFPIVSNKRCIRDECAACESK